VAPPPAQLPGEPLFTAGRRYAAGMSVGADEPISEQTAPPRI